MKDRTRALHLPETLDPMTLLLKVYATPTGSNHALG